MPTIYYKTFPATAPLPPPSPHEMFTMDVLTTKSSLSSPYGSPTSVVGGHCVSSSSHYHRRCGSLHAFTLQGNNSVHKTSLSSPPSSSSSRPPAKVPRVEDLSRSARITIIDDGNSNEDIGDDNETWTCPTSAKARRIVSGNDLQDAIRPIASKIQMGFQRIDRKDPISLASADANVAHIPPCTKAMEAVVKATLYKPHGAGYTHASGSVEARRAIAVHHSSPEYKLSQDHVIVTNGCSGALDLVLETILDEGTTLLVPCPGFPLYQELAEKHGADIVQYRLDPNNRWQCDMTHLEQIMTSSNPGRQKVRALVINNPSSPTGSVYSEQHLEEILSFALRHRLLIITDEVYGTLTFGNNKFHPMAQIAARHGRQVPVITASGLSKQFMVPGWRVGWLAFQDNMIGSLKYVEEGAHRLIQLQHGVNQLAQSAIPTLLTATTPGLALWKEKFRSTLERQGMLLCSSLNDIHCLKVAPPQGAMYAIVHILFDRLNAETINDDMEFASRLVEEENIFVLPGSTFGVPGTFRVAYSASEPTLQEAADRISDFCTRHARMF